MAEKTKLGWPGEPDMPYDVLIARDEAMVNEGKPIRDVIFDFGKVLVEWDPVPALLPRYSRELIDQFLDNDVSGFFDANDMMDGGASNEDGIAYVRRTHGDKWADMMTYYLDNFVDSLGGTVTGARVLVNDLKAAGIGVWGLSNWSTQTFPIALERFDILRSLDDRLVSGYVHLRKPHKEIYQAALDKFGIKAEGAVFIDDKAMNIVGANQVGVRGIRFADPTALRDTLIAAGVGIPAVMR